MVIVQLLNKLYLHNRCISPCPWFLIIEEKDFKLYATEGGKAANKFKGIDAMYKKVLKNRKKEVEAYLFTDKLSKKRMKELAEIRSKALGHKGLMDKLK